MSNVGYIADGQVVNSKPAGAGAPVKSFDLNTQHSPQMAAAIFNDVRNRWNRMPYRALDSNCNHFVNDVMTSLGLGRHPVQYQNSWGNRVPLTRIQSALQNHYGVPCEHSGHNHSGHGPNHQAPHPHSTRIDPKAEILRLVLERLGL
jgi:hypothetical protein